MGDAPTRAPGETNGPDRDRASGHDVLALGVVGTLLGALFFYPGYLNGDANWQYAQALSGLYDDMHPVVMSWLWGWLDRVIEGSGGLFLLMAVGFWTFLGLVLRQFTSSRRAFWLAAVAIGGQIPVFTMVSQVQKDLGMVVGLLGAFGLMVEAERRRSLWLLLAAVPLLFYALAVRHNGVTAVLPFALWAAWMLPVLAPRLAGPLSARWRRVALGLALVATLFAASVGATKAILGRDGRHTPFVQFGMAYDLVGISVRSGRSFVSDLYYPAAPLTLSDLRGIYSDKSCDPLYWGPEGSRKLPFTRSSAVVEKIRRAWLHAIAEAPGAYWAHRWDLFLAVLGTRPETPDLTIEFLYRGYPFDYRGPVVFDLPHARGLVSLVEGLRTTPLFRPWPYLLVGLVAGAWAWWRPNRHRGPISLLAASSLAYVAPLLLIGVSSNFRYLWWPVLASLLEVVLLVDGRPRPARTQAGEADSHRAPAQARPAV